MQIACYVKAPALMIDSLSQTLANKPSYNNRIYSGAALDNTAATVHLWHGTPIMWLEELRAYIFFYLKIQVDWNSHGWPVATIWGRVAFNTSPLLFFLRLPRLGV